MNKHIEMTPEVKYYRDCVETREIVYGRRLSGVQCLVVIMIFLAWIIVSLSLGDVEVFQVLSGWLVVAMIATGVCVEHTESNIIV